MNIQITKRMKDWLKVETSDHDSYDLYAWHANYQTVGGKKFIVLMHNLSKFIVVLYPVLKKEMLNEEFIINVIYHALLNEGYEEELIENYLNNRPAGITFKNSGGPIFRTSYNRQLEYAMDFAGDEGIFFDTNEQLHIGNMINDLLVKRVNQKGYMTPNKEMHEYLKGKAIPSKEEIKK